MCLFEAVNNGDRQRQPNKFVQQCVLHVELKNYPQPTALISTTHTVVQHRFANSQHSYLTKWQDLWANESMYRRQATLARTIATRLGM